MRSEKLPCATCPWRKSTPRGGFPGGIIDAEKLAGMASGDPTLPAMGCHSREASVCVGFALVVGTDSIAYRVACSQGLIPEGLDTDGELHDLFGVLEAHGGRPTRD